MSFQTVFLAAAALLATTNAHVLMKSPVPYSVDKIDNSPITKAQYPCKSQNGFTVSQMNAIKVGEQQTLTLFGSAVHGGGSCQLSVTLDTEPTPNSVFKVIKSMEGGCPGVNGEANAYQFTLPASIPNGKATFAWTWNSKESGAPELYMNCAPIEVTGGASDNSAFEKLPDMLVANIDTTCESVPNFAVQYPNPGSVVQMGNTNDLKPPTGSGCGTSSSTNSTDSSPAAGTASASAPAASGAGGAYAGASSAAAAVSSAAPAVSSAASAPMQYTSTTLVVVTAQPATPSPAEATTPAYGTGTPAQPSSPVESSSPAEPSSPASSSGGSGTCTTNGAVVCNGAQQFGICNNGNVVWQAVAAGTTCANGVITKRGYNGRIARPRYASPRVAMAAGH